MKPLDWIMTGMQVLELVTKLDARHPGALASARQIEPKLRTDPLPDLETDQARAEALERIGGAK